MGEHKTTTGVELSAENIPRAKEHPNYDMMMTMMVMMMIMIITCQRYFVMHFKITRIKGLANSGPTSALLIHILG